MKKMLWLIILLFAGGMPAGYAQENQDGLQLTVKTDQAEYNLAEDIVLIVEFKNVSDQDKTVFANFLPGENLEFIVTGPQPDDGYFVAPVVSLEDPRETDFEVLAAGTAMKFAYILNKYNSYLLDPGEYRIQCRYKNDIDGYAEGDEPVSLSAWKGEVSSGQTVITVKE